MSNLILGWPIYSDASVSYTPSWSGGSWVAGLPLTNLGNRYLHKVARSTNAALTSTIVKCDLGVTRSIRVVAIPKHNLSTAAKARVRILNAVPFVEDNDFDGWTSNGTPVITTGQTDPFGGTRATLINDDDAGVTENKFRTLAFTGNGTKAIAVSMRQGTATSSSIGVYDVTAGAFRHYVLVTWTAGVPSLSTISGAGTLHTPVDLGGGWYQLSITADSVVAANTNQFIARPCNQTATSTGSAYFYEAMAWDLTTQPIVADSGVDDAWPSGLDAEEADGINIPFVYILPSNADGRYIRVEIADTSNADGYVELGRLVVAGGYQPTINMNVGAGLGLSSATTREETDGGAAIYRERPVRRSVKFVLDNITESEAFASAWQMQRRLGQSGQVFFIWNPDDGATLMHERSFLGVLRQLGALEFPYASDTRGRMGFEILEEL